MLFFFFFQAEDGIRDWSVTGVQTCALPISISDASVIEGNSGTTNMLFTVTVSPVSGQMVSCNFATANGSALAGSDRSEERRVGKEGRAGCGLYGLKKEEKGGRTARGGEVVA